MKPGKAIRIVRTARGMSQKTLADRAKIDQSHISLIERNRREPSLGLLETISDVLEVPVYLLVLLGSDQHDLKGISEAQAKAMGQELLRVLLEDAK
jgi:transcriptional regulator with XRE-family HTH domain